MKVPFFSVIIPAFNQERFIGATLKSVFSQTFTDFEVLVVDDGSTDDTVGAVNRSGYPLTLLRQTNQGPGSARNHGLARAGGEFIVFLDGDDLWFTWTLSTFHAALTGNPGCKWVVGQCVEFQAEEEFVAILAAGMMMNFSWHAVTDFFATSKQYFEIYTGKFAISRQILVNAGGYDGELMNLEDGDLYLRMGDRIGIVVVTAPIVFAYRRSPGSTSENLAYAIGACARVLEREAQCIYPGGAARKTERLRIITRYIRPVAIKCLRDRRLVEGWRLYLKTWTRNFRQGRMRFLMGFPILYLWKVVSKCPPPIPRHPIHERMNQLNLILGSSISWFYGYIVSYIPSRSVRHGYLKVWLGAFGAGSGVQIGCRFLNGRKIFFGQRNVINFGCLLDGRKHSITTGTDVSIGPEASILTLGHDPQSPDFADRGGDVVIGDRVWIGYRATILPGVTIGEGAVIGAGSLVTQDVEPYAIVAGNPARKIGERGNCLSYKLNYRPWLA